MTPRPPRPLPDRRPRAVLLGAGDRGAAWLPALLGGPADLVGVMDPDAERARALLAAHPPPPPPVSFTHLTLPPTTDV